MPAPDRPSGSPGVQTAADIGLDGVVLDDARTGDRFDLGVGPPLAVLAVIRHRH